MEYQPPVIERIGSFVYDTADNRRFWSIDWYITGKNK